MHVAEFPESDELFVLSDLLLGSRSPGTRGSALDPRGRLAALLCELSARPAPRLTLVVAGGIVDAPALGASPDELDSLRRAPPWAEVFAALGAFVATPGRRLILQCGPRDLALALPRGQRWFLDALGCDDAARGRATFVLDGSGSAARVGERRVLVTGGSELDEGHAVDPRALALARQAVTRANLRELEALERALVGPLAALGHELRRADPRVEAFLPLTAGTLPVLSAWFPGCARALAQARRAVNSRGTPRLLGSAPGAKVARSGPSALLPTDAQTLLWRAKRATDAGGDARHLPATGMLGAWAKDSPGAPRAPRPADVDELTQALAAWDRARARASSLDDADEAFARLDPQLGPAIDVLITGHSRERRALRGRGHPRRAYFNAGSWAPRLRQSDAPGANAGALAAALLDEDPAALEPHLELLPTLVGVCPSHTQLYEVDAEGALSPLADADGARSPLADAHLPP